MSGRKSFKELTANLSPERREKVEVIKSQLRDQMTLAELRQARHLTQETISENLQVGQPSIAKLEKRTDMYVGTLRRFVEAMDGELEIIARFPDGEVKISNFADIDLEGAGQKSKKRQYA